MTEFNELKRVLDRIAAGTYTDADIATLRQALQTGRITLATGDRAVALGGDAHDLVVITGDNNIVYIIKGPDAVAIWQAVHTGFRSLLTVQDFAVRIEQTALGSYRGEMVGREQTLQQVAAWLQEQKRIIVLHGPGGIGKTRLLLALSEIVPEDVKLWYTRTEAESIERDLAALDRNQQHVIVVDDAHRFTPLSHLREVLVNPDYAGKVKLILSTRSVFVEYIVSRFPQISGDEIAYLELGPLTNADIDRLLQSEPYHIEDQHARRALIAVAEGNPLLAQLGARLVQRGEVVTGLTKDEVLSRYFHELIRDLAEAGYDDRYVRYLEILAALGTIELTNDTLRQRVQEVIGISPSEEEHIVTRLEAAGLIVRYWQTIRIASEVLADHILVSHYFDPTTRRADFQKQVIEPFFDLKAKEILTNLAKAEVKGESREAGVLLGRRLDELSRAIDTQGNIARYAILDWLQNVAYLRADDTLAIVARIVDGREQPPETYRAPWGGAYEISHEMVLGQAVEILKRTQYSALRDTITYLHKLARYRPHDSSYAHVREEARKVLTEIAEFKPRKPYAVQLTLLEAIPRWLAEDFTGNLDLALRLVEAMLSMELHSAETDPTEPFKVIVHRSVLAPTESLRIIRQKALNILYDAYHQATSPAERLRIVQALNGAIPNFYPIDHVPDEIREWLRPDLVNTARFLSDVVGTADLPVLDAISEWLWRARRWAAFEDEALERLSEQLNSHQLYQLYRVLVGWHRWDAEKPDKELDWQEAERRRQEAIECYLDQLEPDTFDQAMRDLETIAHQARTVGETGTIWLNRLLQRLGEQHPELAQQLIDRAVAEELTLKHHLGLVIAGLRKSAPTIAEQYLKRWIISDDATLWLAIAHSYRFVDWAQMKEEDWEILRRLVARNIAALDHEMVWLTSQYAPHNPALAVEVLKTIAARGDEAVLQHIAKVLSWSDETGKGWVVEFKNPQDFLEIIQHFERLSQLDFYVERCLDRLGQIAPMQVIDFIEQRIAAAHERRAKEERYEPVPFQFARAMESIRESEEYPDVLRRVRDWMLRENIWFRLETPRVLKAIAGGLDETLYAVLMEWIESNEPEKLWGIAIILQKFNEGDVFYKLCCEIIGRTDDLKVLDQVSATIRSTPGVILGSLSLFYQKRLEAISPWLEDENLRVRLFARRMVDLLQSMIEREQAEEEWERRSWL